MSGDAAVRIRHVSPLRYPGGKTVLSDALGAIFDGQCGLLDVDVWVEPFAGGAGAGLSLLMDGRVGELWLCESNPALAALWRLMTSDPDGLADRVCGFAPSMDDYAAAQSVVRAAYDGVDINDDELGFAALVVNRCSRSGIMHGSAGPIGGWSQRSYSVSDRWYGDTVAERIRAVGAKASRIRVHEGDGIAYIGELDGSVGIEDEVMLFVDPPYLVEGNRLYREGMTVQDHRRLADALLASPTRWLLTYDADPRVLQWYGRACAIAEFAMSYSANRRRRAVEYAVCSPLLHPGGEQLFGGAFSARWVSRVGAAL